MDKIVKKMGHVALEVSDLDAASRHATQVLGLHEVERADGTVYLSCDIEHHSLMLIESERTAVDHIGLEAISIEALEVLSERLAGEGVEVLSERPEERGIEQAIRFVAPAGHVIEVYAGMKLEQPPSPTAGVGAYDGAYSAAGVRPRKFGHATVRADEPDELAAFLERVLGFVESDRVASDLIWLRCDQDHHGMAVLRGRNELHHYAFQVEGWGELERIGDELLRHGKTLVYGPGRHGPGRNLFTYHYDGAGVCCEYYADLQQIADDRWRGGDWAGNPNAINQWGPPPSDEFMELGTPLGGRRRAAVQGGR